MEMNMKKTSLLLASLSAAVLLGSCGSYRYAQTVFAPDGSSQRTLLLDSRQAASDFAERGWDTLRVEDTSVVFPGGNSASMRWKASPGTSADTSGLGWNERFSRRFRWFTTVYSYHAEYPSPTGIPLPADSMMTRAERDLWLRGEDAASPCNGIEMFQILDELAGKFARWYALCQVEQCRILFAPHLPAQVRAAADTADMRRIFASELPYSPGGDAEIVPEKYAAVLDAAFGTDACSAAYRTHGAAIDSAFGKAVESAEAQFGASWMHSVTMPGTIVSSTSRTVKGATATWYPDAYRALDGPYVMEAVSVRTNWWACVLTALAAGAAVFVILRRGMRRR